MKKLIAVTVATVALVALVVTLTSTSANAGVKWHGLSNSSGRV